MEQDSCRIPVSASHCNKSASAAENGPGVLADTAELLLGWPRVPRGEPVIFLDVGIPVVPSMCRIPIVPSTCGVLLRCCSSAELWELLQGALGFLGSLSLPIGAGSQSQTPRAGVLSALLVL